MNIFMEKWRSCINCDLWGTWEIIGLDVIYVIKGDNSVAVRVFMEMNVIIR